MSKTKYDLNFLVRHRKKIPDEFWVDGAVWFHSYDEGGYDWSAERLGIDRDGNVVWAYDSGCSCKSAWEYGLDPARCEKVEPKKFVLTDFKSSVDHASIEKGLQEFIMLVRKNVKPQEVLQAQNAEVRRYLIKRIGYEKIKDAVKAEVLHKDGHNELLKFNTGETYVKVRDHSTDREYLLYVEGRHTTCRSAIAWTFGLTEEQYKPLIET